MGGVDDHDLAVVADQPDVVGHLPLATVEPEDAVGGHELDHWPTSRRRENTTWAAPVTVVCDPGMTAETIDAEIPYLRSELRSVQVEFESRILDERTVERRAMPVRNGRTATVPPSLTREGLELVSWPSTIARDGWTSSWRRSRC